MATFNKDAWVRSRFVCGPSRLHPEAEAPHRIDEPLFFVACRECGGEMFARNDPPPSLEVVAQVGHLCDCDTELAVALLAAAA